VALFLNEVWLRDPSPASFREFIEAFGSLRGEADSIGLSSDIFRLVAGPWMSIEEAKVVFEFESPDAADGVRRVAKRSRFKGGLSRLMITIFQSEISISFPRFSIRTFVSSLAKARMSIASMLSIRARSIS
jgi:hypothetical protein